VLGAVVFARGRSRASRRTLLAALVLGTFQLGANVALLEGFDRAPAGLVVLLFYIYPLVVTLAAALLLGEGLGAVRIVVLALGLGGVALSIGIPESATRAGIVLGLIAGVCTAGFIVGGRRLMAQGLAPLELVAVGYAGPALALIVATPFRDFSVPSDAEGWSYAVGLLVIASIAALLLFYTAVNLIGASRASLLATAEPLVAVVLAYAVLDERLAATQLVGGALIVAAVVLLNIHRLDPDARRAPHTEAPAAREPVEPLIPRG
jgi:drug/metabolite transporter (DMT)-like permease